MEYELDIEQENRSIKALLDQPKDLKSEQSGTYEEAKIRIKIGIVGPRS